MSEHLPRPLSVREAELLRFMLSIQVPGVESLRKQAQSARVVRECECGCGTIDFGIDTEAPAAPGPDGGPIIETRARDIDDQPAELLLFVRDGRLSSMEIVWYDESKRTDVFPPRDFWVAPTLYRR